MRPVAPSRISQPFGAPRGYASRRDAHGPAGHHTGVDFGSAWPIPIAGRVVRSVLPGEVVISEFNEVMGNWVGVYNHQHDLLVTYWHLKGRWVAEGDWVQPYEILGRVGNTGNSTAAHLHVQVNRGKEFDYHGHVDPRLAFKILTRKQAREIYARSPRHPED